MSNSISYLPGLLASSSGTSSSLLDTIYGGGTSAAGSANPIQALKSAEQTQAQQVKFTAAQPTVKLAVERFTQGVKSAKTVKQLLSNPAVMDVLLTAGGMSDQANYTALATKALTSNLKDPKSVVNQLSDSRWKTLAQTYDFATNGLSKIQDPTTIASVANAYAQTQWETGQDSVAPGLAYALAFKSQASTITSVDQILGNPTLRTVVTTALGIPKQIAFQPLEAQEKAINSRVNIADFKKPAFVEKFVQRYLIANNQGS